MNPIVSHVLAFLGGLGTGVVLKVAVDIRKTAKIDQSTPRQERNIVGGNMAGRDISIKERHK